MTTKTCKHHRPVAALSKTIGWSHCVAKPSACCNGLSHGAVVHVEECRCGAKRYTESNGRHEESSGWIKP